MLSNIDELFDREELSAAPDPGWPDCFNSGVFVFHPSEETYAKLLEYCSEHGSFDGGSLVSCTGVKSWRQSWKSKEDKKYLVCKVHYVILFSPKWL